MNIFEQVYRQSIEHPEVFRFHGLRNPLLSHPKISLTRSESRRIPIRMSDKGGRKSRKVERVTIRMDRQTRIQVKKLAAASYRDESEWIRMVILRALEAA